MQKLAVIPLLMAGLAAPLSILTGADARQPRAPLHHALPDARTILNRSLGAYDAAKTYQGSYTIEIFAGDRDEDGASSAPALSKTPRSQHTFMFMTGRTTTRWRTNSRGDKDREASFTTGTYSGSGDAAKLLPAYLDNRTVDNGRETYSYDLVKKGWSRSPHSPDKRLVEVLRLFVGLLMEPAQKQNIGLQVSAGVEGGRPVYVIQDDGSDSSTSLQVVVDRTDYALRSLNLNSDGDKGHLRIVLFDQVFNAPLSNRVFQWVPPVRARFVPSVDDPARSFVAMLPMATKLRGAGARRNGSGPR